MRRGPPKLNELTKEDSVEKVNLKAKLELIHEHWTPKIVAEVGDMHVKLAKIEGEFVWHAHELEDELFMVISGTLTMELRGRAPIILEPGEVLVVPRGVEHRPVARDEVQILMFEPKTTLNTGTAEGDRTVAEPEWI